MADGVVCSGGASYNGRRRREVLSIPQHRSVHSSSPPSPPLPSYGAHTSDPSVDKSQIDWLALIEHVSSIPRTKAGQKEALGEAVEEVKELKGLASGFGIELDEGEEGAEESRKSR